MSNDFFPLQMCGNNTNCLLADLSLSLKYMCDLCVCDISRQSFSCGHFADIVTWLKKLACSVFKSNLEQCFLCAGVIRELFQTPLSVSGHFLCIGTKSSSRGSSKHCCFIIPCLRCGLGSAREWWRAREACRGESDLLAF